MPRFFLTLEYDGSDFVGWQRQSNGTSVQACLEAAVRALTGEVVVVFAAGRTDAGVHALGQVAHADLPSRFSETQLPLALNAHLPASIRVIAARQMPDDSTPLHARFSATGRSYRYRILNRRIAPALLRGRVWHLSSPLDVDAMHTAAQHLVGNHDFTSFRSTGCQAKSPIRTLDKLAVSRQGDEVVVDVAALSFLHNQVRIMVGSLVLVGQNKWQPDDMARVLADKDRSKAGATAPPHGLYFVRVEYRFPR